MPYNKPGLRPYRYLKAAVLLTFALTGAAGAGITPTFSKAFAPSTIGPGSVSTLTFTIGNSDPSNQMTDIDFSDTLPAGVTIATPASATTSCTGAVLSAPAGGSTIGVTGGTLDPSASCTVSVNVVSSTAGIHSNTSGSLSTSLGSAPPATADLTVAIDRPGFAKSFSPTTLGLGGRSTLTFLIDNTANPSLASNITFTDSFPAGMVIADPANLVSTCPGGTVTASSGGTTFGYTVGFLLTGTSCTLSVDVKGTSPGTKVNLSGELFSASGGPSRSSGKSTASLQVLSGQVPFTKEFLADPVVPGATVTLRFSLMNIDRNFDATGLTFTDDLNAVLPGLVATGLPAANVCGAGSTLSGTSVLTLTGGNLAADGDSCTFDVVLQVPAAASSGAFPNTTSALTGLLGASPLLIPAASDSLFVNYAPGLTKTFTPSTTGAGSIVNVEFTVTNNSATSAASNITFLDNLDAFLPGTIESTALPVADVCGVGSSLSATILSGQRNLILSGGSLAAGGSCTFNVDLQLPAGAAIGSYVNVAGPASATIDAAVQTGNSASDTLILVAAPTLSKEFIDDPVLPGATATLQFTLEYPESAPSGATAIAFTDDLNATLAGLVAVGLPVTDICGTGSSLSGTSNLSFAGGSLAPGESCIFSVTLQVPAGAVPGSYPNSTSSVMATVGGQPTLGTGASDSLQIAGLALGKSFTDDPALPGDTVTLEFTISNGDPANDATGMTFTDNLTTTLTGLAAVGLPLNDVCGLGSQISGTTLLSLTGGNLTAGSSCTFSVTLQVPPAAADGSYLNTTSSLSATLGGMPVVLPAATDRLVVTSERLFLSKSFTDDPVAPGGTVTLEFTVDNLDSSQLVSGITFTDDLDAALSGLVAVGLPQNDVCGLGSQLSGTGLLTLTGGVLPAEGSCTFTVSLAVPVSVPVGTTPTNTTSAVSGTLGGLPVSGGPASDDLQIRFLDFTKAFAAPVGAGATATLTFTIENLSATSAVSGLSFLDDLSSALAGLVAVGLPQNDVCGAGSQISGTSNLSLTNGSLLPGGSCSIPVTVQVPAMATPGTYTNTTGDLFENGLPVAPPATADLFVEPPPTFAKAFAPSSIGQGFVSTLTFTIDNSGSAAAATALTFTDNLPAGMVVATPPAASTTCTGGTITAAAGSGVVSFSGGAVGAGSLCTVQVDVQGNAAGMLMNTSGNLTSSNGDSGNASATLTVFAPPTFAKAFAPTPIGIGGVSTLTFAIDNTATLAAASGLSFSDSLPAGMVVAATPAASTTCTGGTITAVAGSGVISYSGGSVAAGATCTVQVDVQGNSPGALLNTSGALTSSNGTSGTASATLTVVGTVTFTKAFLSSPTLPGGLVQLEYTISNPSADATLTGMTFTDDLDGVIPGLAATGLPSADVCGAGSSIAGTGLVTFAGGNLAPNTSCTFAVAVQVPADSALGTFTSTTSLLTFSAMGRIFGTGLEAGPASADFDVDYLAFGKSFPVGQFEAGSTVALTFTLSNPDPVNSASAITFTDDLDAALPGLTAIGLPASDVCGLGSMVSGTSLITLTGGLLGPGESCSFDVQVLIPGDAVSGSYTNVTSAVNAVVNTLPVAGGAGTVATAPFDVVASSVVVPTLDAWGQWFLIAIFAGLAIFRLRMR